jgi:hypothetical protein
VFHIGTPCSSLHQILNYRLFPICRFIYEVGNMQRLLKPTLQLHLRRSPLGSPELPEAVATLLTQQIYIIWHLSCRIFHSQDHVLWCRISGFGHPRRFARHRFSNMKQSNSRSNPYLLLCMKCDVAEIRN